MVTLTKGGREAVHEEQKNIFVSLSATSIAIMLTKAMSRLLLSYSH